MATIDVKFFTSTMANSPVLAGTAGYLVNVLDACLVDGFGSNTVTDLTVASDVATVTTGTNHGFTLFGTVGPVITIAGASPGSLNGEWRIVSVPALNQFTFATSGIGDQTATGTITTKISPLGWTKAFSGTNNAAYLCQSGMSSQPYLDVWDDASVPTSAAGRWAKWRGYETMSAVQTGTGPFPTATEATNGLSVIKSNASTTAAKPWYLIGDGHLFYLGTYWNSSYAFPSVYVFGVIDSLKALDTYAGHICATQAGIDTLPSYPATSNYFGQLGSYTTTQAGKYMNRGYNGVAMVPCGYMGDIGVNSGIGYGGFTYPNPADNGLLYSTIALIESGTMRSRAMPGLYQPLHTRPLPDFTTITDLTDLPGRALMACMVPYSSTSYGQALFDIVGPWR